VVLEWLRHAFVEAACRRVELRVLRRKTIDHAHGLILDDRHGARRHVRGVALVADPGTIAYRGQPRAQFVANARFSRAARRFQLLRRRVAERVAASAVAPGRERVEFFPADGKPSTGPQSELALDASARTPANCNTASAIHCKIHAAVADFASVEHQRERPAGFKATTAAPPGRRKRNR